MIGQVFQVDHTPLLVPHTYEANRLADAEIGFVEGECKTTDDVIDRASDADVLWLAWNPHIDRTVLESLKKVRLVIRWGIGYEQIDLNAATELGVAVANAPTYGTEDVAEHALALLLALERRIVSHDNEIRNGGWSQPTDGSIHRLKGKTVGLLGVGRIGAALASRAAALGLKVIGHDSFRTDTELESAGVEAVSLDELTRRSDYLSIHVPHTSETEGIINAEFLANMKKTSYLINTARGMVVDEDALLAALENEEIAGAGLDVFRTEPLPAESPFRSAQNVILTSHYAGYSAEAWDDLREEMCTTTIDFLSNGWANTIVNTDVRNRMRSKAG